MQEFIAALGEPDFEEEATPKEPDRPCKGYVFTYYFEKIDAEVTNEVRDKRIEIFFSPNHKAIDIFTNIDALKTKRYSAHHVR